MTLDSIANTQTGYAFRTKIVDDPAGEFCVIQGKDIRRDRSLDSSRLTHIRLPGARSTITDKLVRRDDVLVMTRGDYPYATHVDIDLPPTVVQNSFCQVRVHDEQRVLPRFLAMLLNQRQAQAQLRQVREGTSIPHIKLNDLRALQVSVPPLAQQHQFLNLHGAIQLERELSNQLTRLRHRQLDALLQTA